MQGIPNPQGPPYLISFFLKIIITSLQCATHSIQTFVINFSKFYLFPVWITTSQVLFIYNFQLFYMIRLEETLLENLSVGGRISNFSKIKAFFTKNRTFLTKNNTQNFANGNDKDFWNANPLQKYSNPWILKIFTLIVFTILIF